MAVSWLIILFARPLLTLFTSDREVLRLGVMRIRYILALQFLNAIMDITAGSLRGLGHSALPAVISMAGVCGVRLLYVYTLFRRFNTYSALLVIYPVSWLVTGAIMILCYVVVRRRLTARAAPTARKQKPPYSQRLYGGLLSCKLPALSTARVRVSPRYKLREKTAPAAPELRK
jgi:Na+-driven multidrug efflux pump